MNLEMFLLPMVELAILIIILGSILHHFKQPHVIAYLIAGALLGPHGFGLVHDSSVLPVIGEAGVVLLLFFVGMDLCLPCLIQRWRVPIIGTSLQIIVSVLFVLAIDLSIGASWQHSILFGFIIALSSTAVVIKILENQHETKSKIGQNVIGVLIMQDLAVIPMLIIISFIGGQHLALHDYLLPLIGGLILMAIIILAIIKRDIRWPLPKILSKDKELRVFTALLLCFGMAFLTNLLGLSAALGAFVAGIIIASRQETHWVTESLNPFRIVFVALFFVYMGMIIDFAFITANWPYLIILALGVLILNTLVNAGIIRTLGNSWNESLYSGALLAQIGEFSFVLAAVGKQLSIISLYQYQMALGVISISLVVSPIWISVMQRFTQKKCVITFT